MKLPAALTLVGAMLVPGTGSTSAVFSYGTMTMDQVIETGTFAVTAEAIHAQDREEPVGALTVSAEDPNRASGDAEVCVAATSFVERRRRRTAIREQACPRSMPGFRYDTSTFEAAVVGKVKTSLWTRKWKVIGNRWTLVRDKTVKRSAKLNLTWRWAERPYWETVACGPGGTSYATGLGGPANVSGKIRFKGAGITATVPAGTGGWLFLGACVSPV